MSFVCLNCLKDSYLRDSLKKEDQPCEYCDAQGPCASVFTIAQECSRVIEEHFEPTHGEIQVTLYERTPAGNDLRGTLESLGVVPERVLDDLEEDLHQLWFDRDTMASKYAFDGDDGDNPWFRMRSDLDGAVSSAWQSMEASLRNEARYLNPEAGRVLDSVFGEIHQDHTIEGIAVVADAGPGTSLRRLFRARVFQAEEPLEKAIAHPERLLGTPAQGIGPSGRMNSKGQSAFYGASDVGVALAEVRPPVGAWLATAAFDIVRPIKLLDLRRLDQVRLDSTVSLFDPRSVDMARRRDFLRTLTARLIVPVMPERQDHDYLITQVIADYLATHREGPIDGIIYPSTQRPKALESGDFNVVLFPRSSRIDAAEKDPARRGHLWAYEEDGPDRYLSPTVYPAKSAAPQEAGSSMRPDKGYPLVSHPWPVTLALVQDEVQVHQVNSVTVSTSWKTVNFE